MDNGTGAGTAEQPTTAEQPATGQPSAGQPAAPEASGGGNATAADWLKTAQGGGSAPKPEAAATAPQVAQPPQTIPVPVTSLKRGGILGVIDSIGDVLAGKQRPELGKDPDGNLYVKQHTLTRGEQWMKIAGEAFHGAAAGLAAGRGKGPGAAALGGFQAGEQDQDRAKQNAADMDTQVRNQMLDNANNQMLRMKMAEETWKASRLPIEAQEHDITFAQGQEDRLVKAGSTLLGVTAHPGDIQGLTKANPDLMKDLVQNHALEFIPNYEGGKPAGFKVYKTQQGYRDNLLPAGAEFPTFNSVNGQYDWHKSSEPQTQGQIDDYWTAAGVAATKFKNDKAEADLKAAQAGNLRSETDARNQELPGKIAETAASTAEKRATASKVPSEIAKNWAEAHAAEAKATDDALSNGQGPQGQALVDMIGRGQAPIGRLAYLLARKPELFAAVAAKYPGFDGAKIDGYVRAYLKMTSGKTADELVAGATAMEHMAELRALNTNASHNPLSPEWTAYHAKANQVAVELAGFYGNSTIPGIKSYMNNLSSNLPGKRDSAIVTQADSMADRLDNYVQEWRNSAPSDAYEAKMPGISDKAKAAWASLDPKYKTREMAKITASQGAPAAQTPARPAGVPPNAVWNAQGNSGRGAWQLPQ